LVAKSIFVFGMHKNQAQSEHLYGLRHQGGITFGETRGAYAALAPNATGDPRNRPGRLHTQYIQGVCVVVGKKDFQVAFRICGSSNAEQR